MKLTEEQYEKIKDCFPKHRKAAEISNLDVLNGCKWRGLPKEYGNWHTIYVRMNRWAKSGVLQKASLCLQEKGIININVTI